MHLEKLTLSLLLCASGLAVAGGLAYDNIIVSAAAKYGYDPLLIHAIIQQESGHRANARSGVGAQGLMQLMPATARGLGVSNALDPQENVYAGTRYLKQLEGQFGNIPYALYAYNWGQGNLRSYLKGKKTVMPKETKDYVPKIAKHYKNYGGTGSYFNANVITGGSSGNISSTGIANHNQQKIQDKLKTENACKPVKLPEAEMVVIDNTATIPTISPIGGGSGRTVFDPTKNSDAAMQVQSLLQQYQILKGQYDSVTKGLAGLGLLTNVMQIAGFESPVGFESQPTNIFESKTEQNAYNELQRQIATNTGVYASKELGQIQRITASRVNKAYVDSEVAWTQINCNMQNIKSLADVKPQGLKQAKDLSNAISLENAMLSANQAKLKANILTMRSSMDSYRIASQQAVAKYIGTVK